MKFRHDIVIDADQGAVWAAFDDPANMKAWQPALESFTRKSGEDGQPGAVAELVYNENGRKVTLTETVTERREPHFMAGTYESDVGNALIVNHFEDAGNGCTRWARYGNHSFKGIFRFLSIFFAGTIRKRNEDMMNNFKLFAETQQAERTV
ncbi:MAG: SRPBCC family protein [Gammaproteobacteria bacterium]|nr:SRPBCC family protein [Gammaproteobacteria bacterium]MDH3756930.1 SRPBCC family protein [Gammaproteobacteria bacterium]MDH3847528.1 SRPBCC family protein [Gammaproteobacteria bacterium]MDH3862429.1 SRPBCC family protein [Gammaproteobacteria bacterium]MDH3904485.1 SRPBCC family protein [Gammaproteobacteria bacterium]